MTADLRRQLATGFAAFFVTALLLLSSARIDGDGYRLDQPEAARSMVDMLARQG